MTQAEALIEGLPTEVVIADKGYDSRAVVEAIEAQGAEAVIPTLEEPQRASGSTTGTGTRTGTWSSGSGPR